MTPPTDRPHVVARPVPALRASTPSRGTGSSTFESLVRPGFGAALAGRARARRLGLLIALATTLAAAPGCARRSMPGVESDATPTRYRFLRTPTVADADLPAIRAA